MKYILITPEEKAKSISQQDAEKHGCVGDITKYFYGIRHKIGTEDYYLEIEELKLSELLNMSDEKLSDETVLNRTQLESAISIKESDIAELYEDVPLI